ncbi:DUF1389 domain-containing protein [Chlamydia crocodili]
MLALAIHRIVRGDMRHSLPSGFRSVIKKEFPAAVYDLVVQERLTLQELRAVILGLSSGTFTFPSIACQEKVERFGLERLQKGCEGIELPDLEKILLKNCPFYFVNKFIQLGPKEFPEAENMDPEMYWVSPTGLADSPDIALHPFIWILARVISKEEYETLLCHAQNNTWNEVSNLTKEIKSRVKNSLKEYDVSGLGVKRTSLMVGSPWLLRLCKHGVCWNQLQLFNEVSSQSINLLNAFDYSFRGLNLQRLLFVTSSRLKEDSQDFDPGIALLTSEEWIKEYEKNRDKDDWKPFNGTIDLLNKRGKKIFIELDNEGLPVVFRYDMNKSTGERIRRKRLSLDI